VVCLRIIWLFLVVMNIIISPICVCNIVYYYRKLIKGSRGTRDKVQVQSCTENALKLCVPDKYYNI